MSNMYCRQADRLTGSQADREACRDSVMQLMGRNMQTCKQEDIMQKMNKQTKNEMLKDREMETHRCTQKHKTDDNTSINTPM